MASKNGLWASIDKLKLELVANERLNQTMKATLAAGDSASGGESSQSVTTIQQSMREKVLRGMEEIVKGVVVNLANKETPVIALLNRNSWKNVKYVPDSGLEMKSDASVTYVRFDSSPSMYKFALIMQLISKIYRLVQTNTFSTKRELYYQDTQLFRSQATIDEYVDSIACTLGVPRYCLNVLATSKGCVAGALQFTEEDGMFTDCSLAAGGVMIPNHVIGMHNFRSNAKFILVVEKDATFQKLLDNKVCTTLHPCIMITGKGFPDVNTRMLLHRLWAEFHLPTLLLVDADAHGIEIMCIYKFGSRAMSFDAGTLTVPSVRWLGVLPSDVVRMRIPNEVLIPLTQADLDKARDLKSRPYISSHPDLLNEIDLMLRIGKKAEIQSLNSISPNFLLNVYLKNKIKFGGWI